MGRSPILKDITCLSHSLPFLIKIHQSTKFHPISNQQSAKASPSTPSSAVLIRHTQISLSNMATNTQVAAGSSSAEAARNMFQNFLEEPFGVSLAREYDKSDAETRRHLFLELWQEFGPLVHMQDADRRLPHCRHRLRRLDEVSDISDIDGFDAYDLQDRFRNDWTTETPDSSDDFMSFHDSDMVYWGFLDVYTIPGKPGLVASHQGIPEGGEMAKTYEMISSQLLLYRLMAVFGTPPSNEEVDGYKSIWSYTLHWVPGQEDNRKRGRFVLSDYKGSWSFHFYGPEEASRSALDLLEWLAGDNVPHPYDGVVAGNQA